MLLYVWSEYKFHSSTARHDKPITEDEICGGGSSKDLQSFACIIAAPFSLNMLTVDGTSRQIPGPRVYRHSFEDFHA